MKGKLFVVSGPSGVGKNTLLNAVIDRSENVRYSVSATSRPIRPGEVDGKSYYFVSRERFEALIADDALLEYAEYVGNYYGTPLAPIREAIANGIDVVMDVEVVGALKIKKRLPEEAVLVFVTAPSFDIIRKRLVHRGDVAPGLMEERLERARWEWTRRLRMTSNDGAVTNTSTASSGRRFLIFSAPTTSTSITTSMPLAIASRIGASGVP